LVYLGVSPLHVVERGVGCTVRSAKILSEIGRVQNYRRIAIRRMTYSCSKPSTLQLLFKEQKTTYITAKATIFVWLSCGQEDFVGCLIEATIPSIGALKVISSDSMDDHYAYIYPRTLCCWSCNPNGKSTIRASMGAGLVRPLAQQYHPRM